MNGGTLTGEANLDVRSGTVQFDSGVISVSRLIVTNGTSAKLIYNGGTLSAANTTVTNGQPFILGNGSSSAAFYLTGNGLHTFRNGLVITNAAILTGNGTVTGLVTVASSGSLSPGFSIGKTILSNSPVLKGNVAMEISKSGSSLTNDQVRVSAPLTYGGQLLVTNIGPDALTAGNRFQLFSANSYGGVFPTISLPPLNAGLNWTNNLLVDGTIEVITSPGPKIANVTTSSANRVFNITGGFPGWNCDLLASTNVTLPITNWTIVDGGLLDWMGTTSITNGFNAAIPTLFFRLRTHP